MIYKVYIIKDYTHSIGRYKFIKLLSVQYVNREINFASAAAK